MKNGWMHIATEYFMKEESIVGAENIMVKGFVLTQT
jgi:hypothetical protein